MPRITKQAARMAERGFIPLSYAARALGMASKTLRTHVAKGFLPFERVGHFTYLTVDGLIAHYGRNSPDGGASVRDMLGAELIATPAPSTTQADVKYRITARKRATAQKAVLKR
jgi:hypothetical protein